MHPFSVLFTAITTFFASSASSVAPPPLQSPSACSKDDASFAYRAPDVVPTIDLQGPWSVALSKRIHGPPINMNKAPRFATFHAPGRLAVPRTDEKYRAVWLETQFTATEDHIKTPHALSLGGQLGRTTVWLNNTQLTPSRPSSNAPTYFGPDETLPLRVGLNTLRLKVVIHRNVDGLRWYNRPALGPPKTRTRGLVQRTYTSAVRGKPVTFSLFIPPCVDLKTASLPLLVALPGWGGNLYSFADNALIDAAQDPKRPFLILTPPTGGNVLYTGKSEETVLETVRTAINDIPAIDRDRVHITGLSMGGAGALQIGVHYPGAFASVSSYYGDSEYNLQTTRYIRPILRTPERARRYSALNVVRNASNTPILLVHAKDDLVSPFRESLRMFKASQREGYTHHVLRAFDTGGHSLDLLDQTAAELVEWIHTKRLNRAPERVHFKTDSPRYTKAFWLGNDVQRKGTFSSVEASWDASTQTVHIHAWDRTSKRLTIYASDLTTQDTFSIVIPKTTHRGHILELQGLHRPSTTWTLVSSDRARSNLRLVLNPQGGYEAHDLPPGMYTVRGVTEPIRDIRENPPH